MPANDAATKDTSRKSRSGSNPLRAYVRQSSRPLPSLAFVLPLLAVYEAGVLLLGPQAVRNGADVWLRQFLEVGAECLIFEQVSGPWISRRWRGISTTPGRLGPVRCGRAHRTHRGGSPAQHP